MNKASKTSAVKKATSSKGVISKGFKIPKRSKSSGVDAVIAEMEGKVDSLKPAKSRKVRSSFLSVENPKPTKKGRATQTRMVAVKAVSGTKAEARAIKAAAKKGKVTSATVTGRAVKKAAKKATRKSAVKATTKRPVNAKVATRKVAAKFRAFTSRGGVRRFMGNQVTGKGVEFIYGRKDVDGKTLYFPIVTSLGDMTVDSLQAANIKVDLTIQTV